MKSNLMKKTFGILALGALGLMATAAHADWDGAQANRDRDGYNGYSQGHGRHAYQQSQMFSQQINARQDRQRERIEAGRREGNLRRAEFRELVREQREISSMERNFRADGIIDAREFKRLDRALDVANRNIRTERRDNQQARNAYDHRRFN